MDEEKRNEKNPEREEDVWQPPKILECGKIEARLFSDEPDPWGP